MQISKYPSFKSSHVQITEMNRDQRLLSNKVHDALTYTDEYVNSKDSVDVYFIPGKSDKSVFVRFVNKDSDMYYKKGAAPLQVVLNTLKGDVFKMADTICEKLNEIVNGKYNSDDFDAQKIVDAKTDVAKLRPELYDDIVSEVEEYTNIFDLDEAQFIVANHFIQMNKLMDKSSDF